MTKRNKKGQFTKTRSFFKKVKLLTIAYFVYQYLEPALDLIWTQQAEPYLAQLIK